MKNRSFRILCLLQFLLLAFACQPRDRYVVFTGYAQGGTYSVKANMKDVDVRDSEVRDSIDAILRQIDNSLSGYNCNSLLSRFNGGESIVPDTLFIDIYGRAYDLFLLTGGCVDPASAPLFDLWGFGFRSGELPGDGQVAEVLNVCGMSRLKKDIRSAICQNGTLDSKSVLVDEDAVPAMLNYNAIAQGYSCDQVAKYLYSIGVKDMMVDIGEIFCDGVNPSGRPWTIGIDSPVDGNNQPGTDLQAVFSVPDGPHGVVTSGNYRKFYIRDGKKYAHTVDPRTGYPVSHTLLSATVVAPDATVADAYATHCMVVGLEEAKAFISSDPQLEACLIYDEGGEFRMWTSPGFILK